MNVGARITQLRIIQGISLTNLAKRSGLAQSSLSYIESGKAQPTVETVEKICNALSITLPEFFSNDPPVISPDMRRLLNVAHGLTPRQLKLALEVLGEFLLANKVNGE